MSKFKAFIRRQFRAAPVTTTLIGSNVITFLTTFFIQRQIWSFLAYDSRSVLTHPWTILTYPLIGGHILSVLLLGYVFWWVGSDLEQLWGSREFGLFVAACTIGSALVITAGSTLLADQPTGLAGLGMPLSVVFISWCMVNPMATILVMLVLPVQARLLAYAELAILYFSAGPIDGLFAIAAPLCGWWYVAKGRQLRRAHRWRWTGGGHVAGGNGAERRYNTRSWWQRFNPIARYQREKRRREFERLMKLSEERHHDDETIQ